MLEFALAEARLRGARLRAVQATAYPHPSHFAPAGPEESPALKQMLGEQYPDVAVVEETVHGHPVDVLRQAASGADLLVVGSHGRSMFAGMVLGSVSQELLHQSPCPLAVVRSAR
ncbi:universal stress protein [Nonomuraea basaltis]|uniref:universal stress protein n=1 Tax=Nonomuraea basaltis TaxID=2495887 RepID=UPI001F0F1A3D|nr:universal stress protein [Nonomuraea basaltis]